MDKERAVTAAIDAAVEAFIADQITDADYYFEMAEEFFHADKKLFHAPNGYNANTITTKGAQ